MKLKYIWEEKKPDIFENFVSLIFYQKIVKCNRHIMQAVSGPLV